MKVLVVGAGALGLHVTRQLVERGHGVTATSRSEARLRAIADVGAVPIALDVANIRGAPGVFDAAVYAVAPRGSDDPALAFRDGPLGVLRRLKPQRFVYVSTTGVYEQRDGQWVDEDSEATSGGVHALVREAEVALLQHGAIVVRSGGLYGPGRSPADWLRDPARRARIAAASGRAFMNWIRLEDAAACLVAAVEKPVAGRLYLAVDDEPVRRAEFFDFWSRQIGFPPRAFTGAPADLGKRCTNARAKHELGWAPRFPTYREGGSLPTNAVVE